MRVWIIAMILVSLNLVLWFVFLRPEYRSAFEADQECHFERSKIFLDSPTVGCDHDLETRQWILYDSQNANEKAYVIKRFSY